MFKVFKIGQREVINILNDGNWHSAKSMAAQVDVTESTLYENLKGLRNCNVVEFRRVQNKNNRRERMEFKLVKKHEDRGKGNGRKIKWMD